MYPTDYNLNEQLWANKRLPKCVSTLYPVVCS